MRIGGGEAGLWKKTYQIFQRPAPNILPEGELHFLQYTLEHALYLRLGVESGFAKPSLSRLSQRDNKIIENFKSLANPMAVEGFNDASDITIEEAIKHALVTSLGEDLPKHIGFIKQLKQVVKKEFVEQKGLIRRDMMNIKSAWDTYAAKTKQGLLKLEEYPKIWNNEHKKSTSSPTGSEKYRTEGILSLKKEWILFQRRQAKKGKRTSRAQEEGEEQDTAPLENENSFQPNPSPILGTLNELPPLGSPSNKKRYVPESQQGTPKKKRRQDENRDTGYGSNGNTQSNQE
ncbi:hypothetical protein G7Y89_g277 [Cudoniella acicularis]|uniref:Uncharacterized protein n=1 Tax=Cudoniella acicularis TaxID=354080 RepID=A0A8H4RZG1_9HELO|nr:hypothetical protein G7Y89_g277 [Cudoniella acicularis]